MKKDLYSMIFKRKSFHIFRDIGSIDSHELQTIFYKGIMPSEKGFRFSSGL